MAASPARNELGTYQRLQKFIWDCGYWGRSLLARRMAGKELPDMLQQLVALLEAGWPLRQAVLALNAVPMSTFQQNYINALHAAIEHGKPLASVWTDRLPLYLIVLMRAGETSGTLSQALTCWCVYEDTRRRWLQKVVRGTAYPLFLIGLVICLLIFVITRLLPTLATIPEELGMQSGVNLRRTIALVQWLPTILVCVGISFILGTVVLWTFMPRANPKLWRRIVSHTPGQEAVQMARTTAFSGLLATLLEAGIPLADCLGEIGEEAPSWMAQAARHIRNHVLSGHTLCEAFQGGWHPVLGVSLGWAEQTGDMAGALRQTQQVLQDRLERWVERRTRLIEPMLILFTGVLVGGVMWLVFTPMYDVVNGMSHQALH